MTDLPTLLAELGAHYAKVGEVFRAGLTQGHSIWSDEMPAVNALVNAYPALKEGIAQLQRERDAEHDEHHKAERRRAEALAAVEMAEAQRQVFEDQLNDKLAYIRERDALLTQRTEALRGISEHFPCEAPCKLSPAQGKCGECGAYRFETWCAGCVARAALATEENRG